MDGYQSSEAAIDTGQPLLSGQFVLHTLITEFTSQVDKKVDALLSTHLRNSSAWTKEEFTKSLQRGEDPQFDQLLSSLGCVAEYCLPSLLDTLFGWYDHQVPNKKSLESAPDDKQHKQGSKGKSDSHQLDEDTRDKCREVAVEFVFCLVLIEVLKQIPYHPLPDSQIRPILARAFKSFHSAAQPKVIDNLEIRIIADLYAEATGVLAQAKFQAVRNKFMYELLKDKEAPPSTLTSLIMGMKYFRVKMYPIEDFEASFRFLQELATYSLDIKNREVKHALAALFVEVLVPVAAAVKTEVNVPVLRDFVDSLYPTSLELSKRAKNKQAMYPLITCLLCVSQKTFFLNNWHIFLDNCLSTLKSRDQKLSRVALESIYRLLWAYTVRIKCESNLTTQVRLQSIVKNLFPPGSRNVIPKDTPLNIFVKIIQFIALERLDYAMKEIILDLLSMPLSGSRTTKPVTLYPERMNIGLRAFLVITDSLQQKDGAPPMPSTMNVMPSGNTIRVKKTFLNKTLTEDESRTIGVAQCHKHVQRALDGILLALDSQVGMRMMLTNSQFSNKDPQDVLSVELKPKIELFRTCVAAMPRLMPQGMSHSDLLEMLCRLTVHIDDDLRSRAIASLQAFVIDFPMRSEEVVASFLSFVLKQVSDIHQNLLESALKILASLISAWKNNIIGADVTTKAPANQTKNGTKMTNNVPLAHTSTSPTSGICIYAPIINRIEGFTIILLCSSRSSTRKLACHILKEVRFLARALEYGTRADALCLDVLDSLCPEVAEEVLSEGKHLQGLKESEKEAILTVAYEKELSSLLECSSNWQETDGFHPWVLFMNSFIEISRLPKFCPTAMSYSWPDVYIRLSQIQRSIEPMMTTGSKKVTVSVTGDHNLVLWTNYLIFACKSSPSSVFVKQKQSVDSAIPAGTPDWKVALIRDGERIDAVPATLFQRSVSILRSEYCQAYKAAAVTGLGYTSVTAFHDLLTETLHLIHEASETKKQENVRRRRRRDNIRVVLVKLFANLASHKILSAGILKNVEKISGSQKIPKEIVQDYIEETRAILEALDKSETSSGTSFSSQQPAAPSTSFGSQTSTVQSSNVKDEMRLNFAEVVIQLIRNYPVEYRLNLLSAETRKKLFMLFRSWYENFSDAEKFAYPNRYPLAMMCAECSVLCCGPVFDCKGLETSGYLYHWLESLLNSGDTHTHQLGLETVMLLLHFNTEIPDLLTWLIDKSYTGSDLVATSCFLGIATVLSNTEYQGYVISIIVLTLLKATETNAQVAQAAEHLMPVLLQRFFQQSDDDNAKSLESQSHSNSLQRRGRNFGSAINATTPSTVARSHLKMAEDLARSHPEITHALLSEIFMRFPTANLVSQRHLLEVVQPWLQNVELVLTQELFENPYEQHKMTCTQNHPWLPQSGWGSEEATLHVLNNLMYLTARHYQALETELQHCWSVLCSTWHTNLPACLQYIMALYSVHTSEPLRKAARLAVTYIGRSKGSRVTSSLIEECQVAEPIFITLEKRNTAPFYKVSSLIPKADSNKDSPVKKPGSPEERKYLPSEGDFIAQGNDKQHLGPTKSTPIDIPFSVNNEVSRSVSPVVVERRTPKTHSTPVHHRLSLQVPLSSERRSHAGKFASESSPIGAKYHPVSALSSRSPVMSSSMMSLNNMSAEISTPSVVSSLLTPKKHLKGNAPIPSKQATPSVQEQMKEFYAWSSAYRDEILPAPLPVPSNSVLLRLDEFILCESVDGLLSSSVACIFLSELVFYRSVDINWYLHLPSVMLSLILNMDQVQIPDTPFYCRRLLAHIFHTLLPEKIPSEILEQILSFFMESSLHILAPQSVATAAPAKSQPKVERLRDSYMFREYIIPEMLEGEGDAARKISEDKAMEVFLILLKQLVDVTKQLWGSEDVTPKNAHLKSIDVLSSFVQTITDLFELENPRLRLRERLGSEASKYAVSTMNKHLACRALQVFRALQLPLTPIFFNKLVRCLVNRITYGSDLETQSQVIEIITTLLNDCDIPSSGRNEIMRESSFSPKIDSNRRLPDKETLSLSLHSNRTQSEQMKKPRSPTPGRLKNFPTSPVRSGPAPLSLPSNTSANAVTPVSEGGQPDAPKRGRKVHAHRRSGSVTISKKMAAELSQCNPTGFHASTQSVSGVPTETGFTSSRHHHQHGDASGENHKTNDPCKEPCTKNGHLGSKSAGHDSTDHILFDESEDVFSPVQMKHKSGGKERKSTFAQIFWIGVALLESDYEHEFLIAVQLIEKVLTHLPLYSSESRHHIERYLHQIKWNSFPGIQTMLLKGLTSSVTYNATYKLLSSFTTISDLKLISGGLEEGSGFAMNVVSLLPHLLESFSDPDQMCVEAAQNIANACVENYSQKKKLQSLAHVMSLYCNRSYGKPCMTWISVVCKYIHETFPEGIRDQLNFVLEMLDKGPVFTHTSCLRIVYSLLSLSEVLYSHSPSEASFTQHILRAVSKFVNSARLWKEALNILKLAVSRSSAIASPTAVGFLHTSSSLSGDIDRIELPGRTLTFEYDLTDTPIVGRRRPDEHLSKRQTHSNSPSYHPSTASSIITSWRRPYLSQKRTYDSILCVLPICGKHLQASNDPSHAVTSQERIHNQSPERFPTPTQEEELQDEETDFEAKDEDDESSTGDDENGSVVDDIRVLRNFDFLDDFEENDDGFTVFNQGPARTSQDNEANNAEEDPDTCNLTPIANRETARDPDLPPHDEDYGSDEEQGEGHGSASLTSGILSQSWSGTKSIFTELEKTDTHSSLIMISSITENEKPHSEIQEGIEHAPHSSEGSISITDSPRLLLKSHLRCTQSESALDKNALAASSSESFKTSELEKTNERDENTSESISNIDESENDMTYSSPVSSTEDLRTDTGKSLDVSDTSSMRLMTPPTLSSASTDMQSLSEHEGTLPAPPIDDIPMVEPPPTSDITANLSAIRFDSPSHFLSTTESPSRLLLPTSFSFQERMVCQNTTYTAWKLHMASMATYSDSAFISKTFDLFPTLFKVLCVDFSNVSKEGCKHLGGQLSKIAEHFSSMVEQLPSQIKCPTYLATKSAIDPVVEQMKLSVLELQDHLDTYNAKQKDALDCIELIKAFQRDNKKEGSSYIASNSMSQGIEYKRQLELCRILYKLHFQLLLLLKSFNKLVRLIASSTAENKDISEQIVTLKKKILVVEKTFHAYRDKPDMEMRHDLKSMAVKEAEQALTSSISSEHVHRAIRQLSLLRELWKPEIFGGPEDSAADFLTKIYFRHLEDRSGEKFFAILGPEDSSHDMCEKLMEVNGQIQQSLDSLAMNAGDMSKTPPTTKKTHL